MMRQKKYIQRIPGKLIGVTLMPTYGTPSWLFNEELKLQLPKKIDRNENESLSAFDKRVNHAFGRIEKKISDRIGVNQSGLWRKDRFEKVRNIRHDCNLSELTKHG